jgi:hypothetical protein
VLISRTFLYTTHTRTRLSRAVHDSHAHTTHMRTSEAVGGGGGQCRFNVPQKGLVGARSHPSLHVHVLQPYTRLV